MRAPKFGGWRYGCGLWHPGILVDQRKNAKKYLCLVEEVGSTRIQPTPPHMTCLITKRLGQPWHVNLPCLEEVEFLTAFFTPYRTKTSLGWCHLLESSTASVCVFVCLTLKREIKAGLHVNIPESRVTNAADRKRLPVICLI